MIINRINTLNFKSNEHREAELRELRRLKELRRQYEEEKLIQSMTYPEIDNQISTKAAGFFSKFTCAIQNASEHNIMEFFGDENTAKDLRKISLLNVRLTAKCSEKKFKDGRTQRPCDDTYMCKQNEKFAPKQGILSEEQNTNFVEGIKKTISTIVRNSNLDRFEPEDKASILEMVQK